MQQTDTFVAHPPVRRLIAPPLKSKRTIAIWLLTLAIVAVALFVLLTRQEALVRAAASGDLAGVRLWAGTGANVDRGFDQTDGSVGWPPLMIAARQGHDEVVRYLLARGANPNLRGMSNPLIAACSQTGVTHREAVFFVG